MSGSPYIRHAFTSLSNCHSASRQPDPLTLSSSPLADVLAARAGGRRAGITLWQGLRHLASLQEFRCENQGVGPVRADMPLNAWSAAACAA